MQTSRRHLGNEGERLAADYLRSHGFRILERQSRIGRIGEIDLIALDVFGSTLVFIEVKTRHVVTYGQPEEALTASKRRRLSACAESWRHSKGWTDRPWRLDVVAVDLTGREPLIRHHQNIGL